MRVLHVYAGNLYGGVERMLATFAATRVPGLEHAFALGWDGRLADELRAADVPLAIIGGARMSRPWTVMSARRRLGDAIDQMRPGVVICHSTWAHGLFAPVARARGIPLVFWLHDAVTGGTWADRLARRTPPDIAICTSEFARTTLSSLWPHVRGEVVYPPVAQPDAGDGDRGAVRASLDTPEGDFVILQASRMEPWKGHRLLIQALATIRSVDGWTCWIAGGAQRPAEEAHLAEMYALAQQLGVAHRVRFLGERRDVPRLMAAADVLCAPNLGPEPFGISSVEALYAGLPIVATEMGGAPEVISGNTGILVAPDDPAALGDALRRLASDAALRARLGAAGPARARALSHPPQQAERLRNVLHTVTRDS